MKKLKEILYWKVRDVFYNTLPKLPQVKLYNWGALGIMEFFVKKIKKMLKLGEGRNGILRKTFGNNLFCGWWTFFIEIQTLGSQFET